MALKGLTANTKTCRAEEARINQAAQTFSLNTCHCWIITGEQVVK